MQQVRFQLEQTREGLQRQLAGTDGQMHVLQARLEDSNAEQQVCSITSRMHLSRTDSLVFVMISFGLITQLRHKVCVVACSYPWSAVHAGVT